MESWAGMAAISKLDLKRPRVADPTFLLQADNKHAQSLRGSFTRYLDRPRQLS